MNKNHKYYFFHELPKLLVKHCDFDDISKIDLLRWGASGELQFSIFLSPHNGAKKIKLTQQYYDKVILGETEQAKDQQTEQVEEVNYLEKPLHQDQPEFVPVPCDIQEIYRKTIFEISKNTVERILLNELDHSAGRKTPENVTVEILPWCDDIECKSSNSCHVEHEMIYDSNTKMSPETPFQFYCTLSDLIVTPSAVLTFIENMPQKEVIPPYLDETNPGYNSELAIVIETWKALFIDKEYIEESTAKQAAIKYIESKYPDYEGDTKNGTGSLGRAALMLNKGLVKENAWSSFRKEYGK